MILPSLFFAVCMVFGRSYDLTDSAEIVLGDKARIICAWIGGAGWMLLAVVAFYLAFECLDWLSSRRIPFSEAHFGRIWRVAHAVLSVHPFAGPFLVLMIAWAPTLIASLPGLFMGDTGAQIRQWFNYPNGTSDYLRLLNPNVLLNGHHPVVHTAIIGSCVQLGLSLFNSANAGLAIYTCAQFVITAACMAYSISSLRKLGVSLPVRGVILLFFVFMPMFSNYAALLTKDVLFADAFLVLLVQTVKLVACGLPRRDANAERAGEQRPVLFARHDWLLLALGAMGSTFLRNGGLVFPLAGMRNRGSVLRMGRTCGLVAQPSRLVLRLRAPSRVSAGWEFLRCLRSALPLICTSPRSLCRRTTSRLVPSAKSSRFRSSRRLVSSKSTTASTRVSTPRLRRTAPSWRLLATAW